MSAKARAAASRCCSTVSRSRRRRGARSPPRRAALAEKIAEEWNAQAEVIDPARMPLTRLANAVIDAVAEAPGPVADDVAQYLGSDLLCYRAEAPDGLVERQTQAWDPVLAWAREALGARFVLAPGRHACGAAARGDRRRARANSGRGSNAKDIWRLGAVSSITTLTGSGLLALALSAGAIDAEAAWAAAHVDEDWQMSQWGRDDARARAPRLSSCASLPPP